MFVRLYRLGFHKIIQRPVVNNNRATLATYLKVGQTYIYVERESNFVVQF
jgi:hypothetical protein